MRARRFMPVSSCKDRRESSFYAVTSSLQSYNRGHLQGDSSMRRSLITALIVLVALPLFATEPNPSARQRELIEKLLEITDGNKAALSMMDAMFGQIEKQFLQEAAAKGNDPEDIEEAKEMFTLFRERASKIDMAGLLRETSIRIYAKYFTESELVDLTTFYESATGRKSIEVMPLLVREGMEAGVEHVGPQIDKVM